MIPGEVLTLSGDIELNAGQPCLKIAVANSGDRPIQVGSHYHFAETNAALVFDRAAAHGMRLDIVSGTAIRFEPGQSREVALIPFGGAPPYHRFPWPGYGGSRIMACISRQAYAHMFGPTVGDRMRLADTELFIEIERDFTTYGDEVKFGGGKVIRDGMGQSQLTNLQGAMDTVITNAVIIDHWGIVKADVGLRA